MCLLSKKFSVIFFLNKQLLLTLILSCTFENVDQSNVCLEN